MNDKEHWTKNIIGPDDHKTVSAHGIQEVADELLAEMIHLAKLKEEVTRSEDTIRKLDISRRCAHEELDRIPDSIGEMWQCRKCTHVWLD